MPRPIDDPAVPNAGAGDGSDIGAVEFVAEGPQTAAHLVVTTVADTDDGACTYLHCTLREAINAANTMPGSNTIGFAAPVTGAILLTSPLPAVTDSVLVQGPAAPWPLTVDGNKTHRVFSFLAGESTLSGLTIRNGYFSGAPGGAAIFNQAGLSVADCTLWENRAAANPLSVGTSGTGGAVYNSGVMTFQGCTFRGNSAAGSSGVSSSTRPGTGGSGAGGVFNDLGATLSLSRCTVYQNSGTGGSGGNAPNGGATGGTGCGGVYNQGTLTVTSCTFNLNSGVGGPGGTGLITGPVGTAGGALGQRAAAGTNMVRNTILWGNLATGSSAGPDTVGDFNSGGYNLLGSSQGGSGFTATGDEVGSDPNLGPLARNLGPTETMAVFLDSAALDKGHSFGLELDQRGLLRRADSPASANAPGGDGTDIGAFEFSPTSLWDINKDHKEDLDSDGDSMPDYFEIFYGLNLLDPNDAAGDMDGDGNSNLDEFWQGTDPRDPASLLRITAIWQNGKDIELTFAPAQSERSYELQRKDGLTSGEWGSIYGVAPLSPHTVGTAQFTDPTISGSTVRFYRVRVRF
jgi:CSLREA domain-containing protein